MAAAGTGPAATEDTSARKPALALQFSPVAAVAIASATASTCSAAITTDLVATSEAPSPVDHSTAQHKGVVQYNGIYQRV